MWFFLTLSVLCNFVLVAIVFAAVSRQQTIIEANIYLKETLQMYLTDIVLELDDEDEYHADGSDGKNVRWE